ncbi:MAG: hypothetical protein KatS3mg096_448 [Candidatus Parcubacteria bacterium]|nr:MAG: hypothetical protein KatS3mg096_448 [Candidatus Parcubacteria bacterium]
MDSGLDVSWNNANPVSWSFWVKPNNVVDSSAGILGKIYPGWEWAFYQSGAAVHMVYWDAWGRHANGMDADWSSVLTVGQWIHLVYTWNGSTSRFYADGALKITHTATNPSINQNRTNNVMIGGHIYVWGDKFFKGLIDEVRIYNRALSDAEIKALYEATK